MKHVVTFFLLFIAGTTLLFSQTEMWRMNGYHSEPVKSNDGSLYVLYNSKYWSSGTFDHLKRVSPEGTVLWTYPLPTYGLHFIYGNSKGVYHLSHQFLASNAEMYTLSCVDSLGNVLWSRTFTNSIVTTYYDTRSILRASASADNEKNIVIVLRSQNTEIESDSLLRINEDGEVIMRTSIQPIPLKNKKYVQHGSRGYYEPIDDGNGNFWLFSQTSEYLSKSFSLSDYERFGQGFMHGIILSKSTGAVIKKKYFLSEIFKEHVKSKNGTRYDFFNGNRGGCSFLALNQKVIIYFTGSKYIESSQSNGDNTLFDSDFWQWQTINFDLKIKNYTEKGNAVEVWKEEGTYYQLKQGSRLSNIVHDLQGNLYLTGTLTEGKIVNGIGTIHYNGRVLKFDSKKGNKAWKYTVLDSTWSENYYGFITSNNLLITTSNSNQVIITDVKNKPNVLSTYYLPSTGVIPSGMEQSLNDVYGYFFMQGGQNDMSFAKYAFPLSVGSFTSPITNDNISKQFSLSQNYPNPFNPSTVISYQLPVDEHVTLKVFNLLGQEIATLVDEVQEAGELSVEWDASGFPSGMYYYMMKAGTYEETKKLILMK